MKALLALAALVVPIAPAAQGDLATEPIEAAITEIMSHPDYDQMCRERRRNDFENKTIRFPVYTRLIDRNLRIAPQQLLVLQDRRAEVVPALKKMLADLHPEKPAVAPTPAPNVYYNSPYYERPDQLNALYLFMVSDLHIVEALPELLKLEERLRGAIENADKHHQAPPPDIAVDAWIHHPLIYHPPAPPDDGISDRERLIELSRVDQVEILSLMLRLLREQQFLPVLESEFEKRYQEKCRRPPGALGPDDDSVEMPFSAGARDKVRKLVCKYLVEHPPAK